MNDSNQLRSIIYGAGAVGGVVGANLCRSGNDVILIGRSGHVNIIREQGLRLVTPLDTHVVQVPAVAKPEEIDFRAGDVVFLCVKSQQTEEALQCLGKSVKEIPVFCFQNGVRNEETAARHFREVYGVTIRTSCVFLKDGEVVSRWEPPGWIILGRYPEGTDGLVELVAAKLRGVGYYVLATPEIMPYKWGKLLDNLVNAVGAITDTSDDEEDNKYITIAARYEARQVLLQAGVRWVSSVEMAREWRESTLKPRHNLDIKAPSSTWQSLARQLGMVETEFFNGEIVKLARQLGIPAPVNETLLRISQEMAANHELPGKYTLAELRHLVGLG